MDMESGLVAGILKMRTVKVESTEYSLSSWKVHVQTEHPGKAQGELP